MRFMQQTGIVVLKKSYFQWSTNALFVAAEMCAPHVAQEAKHHRRPCSSWRAAVLWQVRSKEHIAHTAQQQHRTAEQQGVVQKKVVAGVLL